MTKSSPTPKTKTTPKVTIKGKASSTASKKETTPKIMPVTEGTVAEEPKTPVDDAPVTADKPLIEDEKKINSAAPVETPVVEIAPEVRKFIVRPCTVIIKVSKDTNIDDAMKGLSNAISQGDMNGFASVSLDLRKKKFPFVTLIIERRKSGIPMDFFKASKQVNLAVDLCRFQKVAEFITVSIGYNDQVKVKGGPLNT